MRLTRPCFWLRCDLCGLEATSGGGLGWGSAAAAEEAAEDSWWHVEGGNHLCDACDWAFRTVEDTGQ